MRHRDPRKLKLNKSSIGLVFFAVLFVFSLTGFSANKKFGMACRFSVNKTPVNLDDFTLNHLESDLLIERDTGKKYGLLLPMTVLEKRTSTKQTCGTCFAETGYNLSERLIEQSLGGQFSVDRVDLLARIFKHKLQMIPEERPENKNIPWIGDTKNYLEKWAKKKSKSGDIKNWIAWEKTYDFVSSGSLEKVFRLKGEELEGIIPTHSVLLKTLPQKTRDDLVFENAIVAKMNRNLVAATKSIFQENISVYKTESERLNKIRDAKEAYYRETSKVFQQISKFDQRAKASQVPKIANLNHATRKALYRLFGYTNLSRKFQVPEGILTLITLKKELDKLSESSRKGILSDPWLRDIFKDLSYLEKKLADLDQEIKSKILAKYEEVFKRSLAQANAYWKERIKLYPVLREEFGLRELLVKYDFNSRAENVRKIHLRKNNYYWVENIVKALNEDKVISVSYNYYYDHRYIPSDQSAEFRVMDLVANPNHKKTRNPITGRPYANGGGHADVIINAIIDPITGKVSHFVLQGSHGSSENWNGKYLLSVDYFIRHAMEYTILEPIGVEETQDQFMQ